MKKTEDKSVKVSVIMGVFITEPPILLKRAVKSIINQSFKDWEMIIVNDGSPQKYQKEIRDIAKLDTRIKLIEFNENKGLSCALNECIRRSVGEFTARMDADDIAHPDRLKIQYDFLKNNPQFSFVGSNACIFDSHGVKGAMKMPNSPQKSDFLINSPFIHPSVMFRKSSLLKAGGYSELKKFHLCEDYELFMRLYSLNMHGFNIQKELICYFEDDFSFSRRTYSRRIREAATRLYGFKSLGILSPLNYLYVIKPLLAGLLPSSVLKRIRRYAVHFDNNKNTKRGV